MLYDIKLGINYIFQAPAAGARQILHAMPLTIPGRQRLIAGSVDIDPAPAMRRERQDFFGNRLTEIATLDGVISANMVFEHRELLATGAEP